MRNTISLGLTLSALFAAGIASATDPAASGAPDGGPAQWRQRFFDQIDTNHDGTISRTEYQAWVDGRFDRLDANGDDVVDASEIANSPTSAERAQKRAERFVQHYDTSGTGEVSKADFEAKAMQRFDRMSNGADSITQDEFAAARPHRHRHAPPTSDGG
jgi:EF hand